MKRFQKLSGYLVAIGMCVASMTRADVGGFVDAQIFTGTDTANSPTFQVGDGAVYLWHEGGGAKGMVDIPFKFETAGTAGDTNSFDIATTKAQAYITKTYDMGARWSLGQFDGLYGVDMNDSVHNKFSRPGAIKAFLPVTHTALLTGYTAGAIDVAAFAGNAGGVGQRNGANFEFGGQVKWTGDPYYATAGYMMNKSRATAETSTLLDVTGGGKFGDMTIDGEFAMAKVAVAGAETGIAFGGHLGYMVNSTWWAGARVEYLTKMGGINSVLDLTVGPTCKLSDKFQARINYTLNSTKLLSTSTATTSHVGVISGIYKF